VTTASQRGAALDQILLVIVPFTVWLALSDRLFRGPVLRLAPSPILHVAATAVVALLLVSAALALEADRLRALGLGPMRPGAAVAWGLFAAAAAYAANAVAAALYLMLAQRDVQAEIAHKAQGTARLAQIPLGWVVPIALLVGVYEEVLFRGFLLGRLRLALRGRVGPRVALAVAVLASSALFGAGHAYQGALGVLQTFTMGVVLALVAVRCGSIWPCIVAHAVIDTIGLFVLHGLTQVLARPP
jgi:membrane protease YdiL (CAAX protease family)